MDSHYVSDAQHFLPLKDSARKHNETVYFKCGSEELEIQADHVISGNPSEEAREKCLLGVKMAAKYSEVLGLQRLLKVGVGLAYTTSVNVKTDDGLINGPSYILKKYITSIVMLVNIQIFYGYFLMMKLLASYGDRNTQHTIMKV